MLGGRSLERQIFYVGRQTLSLERKRELLVSNPVYHEAVKKRQRDAARQRQATDSVYRDAHRKRSRDYARKKAAKAAESATRGATGVEHPIKFPL